MQCTACQTIQAFGGFRQSSLAVWRQSFVPNGRRIFFIRELLMVINIHIYFFSGLRAKIKTQCNVHAIYLSGWMYFSLFRSNKLSQQILCCLLISKNLYKVSIRYH